MELKLSIQFQSIHKWKSIARRLLKVIKHLPHKIKRYMKWASKASADAATAHAMEGDNLYYDDQSDFIDEWYDDETNEQWVVSSAQMDDDNMYWDDAEIWSDDAEVQMEEEEAMKVNKVDVKKVSLIKTENGNDVNRKCMHMMGGRLCFCQFMAMIDSPKYHCHPQQQSIFGALSGMNADNAEDVDVDEYMDEYYFDDNANEHEEEEASAKIDEYADYYQY